MTPKPSDLWRVTGTVSRGSYFAWGLLLVLLKVNLDRLVLILAGQPSKTIFDPDTLRLYLWQGPVPVFRENLDGRILILFLLVTLPFLWAGMALTMRRLRSLGWRPFWSLLFFVPAVKFIFFAVLCILDARGDAESAAARGQIGGSFLDRILPRNPRHSLFFSVAFTGMVSFLAGWLGTAVFKNYGYTLFIGMPFAAGLLAVLLDGLRVKQTPRRSLWVANATVLFTGLTFLLLAVEGVICLAMAAPISLILASLGGLLGYRIQRSFLSLKESPTLLCSIVALLPLAFCVESAVPPELPLIAVRTQVIVNAPPSKVWNHVVTFSELPPPQDLVFKLGVAYPIRAEILGKGVGAVRNCIFSTGPFVEPIEVWDEPCLLKFSVTRNPAPMQEWTPYRDVHPAHLDGYLESRAGQFKLTPLEDGGTQLEGTTWYQHRLWPMLYWRLWSDHIIHTIHQRVLRHVKNLSESDAALP